MSSQDPKFASIPKWQALTGMSRTGTYKALGRGELKVIKLGSKLLLDVDHGLAWLRSQPAAEIRAPKAA
jgi:hypothetical protein